jgi:hypothetical protein
MTLDPPSLDHDPDLHGARPGSGIAGFDRCPHLGKVWTPRRGRISVRTSTTLTSSGRTPFHFHRVSEQLLRCGRPGHRPRTLSEHPRDTPGWSGDGIVGEMKAGKNPHPEDT